MCKVGLATTRPHKRVAGQRGVQAVSPPPPRASAKVFSGKIASSCCRYCPTRHPCGGHNLPSYAYALTVYVSRYYRQRICRDGCFILTRAVLPFLFLFCFFVTRNVERKGGGRGGREPVFGVLFCLCFCFVFWWGAGERGCGQFSEILGNPSAEELFCRTARKIVDINTKQRFLFSQQTKTKKTTRRKKKTARERKKAKSNGTQQ